MPILKFTAPGRPLGYADLQARIIDYTDRVEELRSPDEVLDELHTVTTRDLSLSVLGAARFPLKSGDWESVQLGKSVFLHMDVPEGWREEYDALARANSVRCCSWRRPVWRHTHGLRLGGCFSPLELTSGPTT